MERAWKPNVEISPHCPRCGSSNTKFCYYNNYSLTQPRYFCKGCRRYWTKGGSLRNVPVGGGCRKNRKNSKIFRSSSSNGFRSLAYSGIAHAPMVQHMGSSSTGNSAIEPTSSSMMSDGSNIDLALVFANFVNQKPEVSDTRRDYEKPELCSESCHIPRGVEYSSLADTNVGLNCTLPEDIGAYEGCPLYGQSKESQFHGVDQMFLSGLSSFQKHQHRMEQYTTSYDGMIHLELPPLPGEEASQEFMWSNSELMLNHGVPPAPSPMLEHEVQDADLLIGNWSPFDLSKDDPFPKPL